MSAILPGMADPRDPEISALLHEDRVFEPPTEFRASAIVRDTTPYEKLNANPKDSGHGSRPSSSGAASGRACSTGPIRRTRSGSSAASSTSSVNCVDRHVRGARRNKAAIIWEGEPGDRRTLTYFDLYRQVSAFANVLKSLGVTKGDRVAIYMPLVPELAVAMLACARIGAPHSIVFGGFSAESLRDRINDAQCKLLITADGGYRRGSIVPLRKVAFEAIDGAASVTDVIVFRRLIGSAAQAPATELEAGRKPECASTTGTS